MKIINRQKFLFYLKNRAEAKKISGNFLSFFEIAIIERFGQWRFAGSSHNLDEAINKIEKLYEIFIKQYNKYSANKITLEKDWFMKYANNEILTYHPKKFIVQNKWPSNNRNTKEMIDNGWNPFDLSNRNIGPANGIILAKGTAPYDDTGFAILEVDSLIGHPYQNRSPESIAPKSWFGGNWEEDWDALSPDEFIKR